MSDGGLFDTPGARSVATGPRAVLSDCGRYRYELRRVWDSSLPVMRWIMLNPSTADALHDDATIRKLVRYAKSWGYGGFVVHNLFAWRATNPAELAEVADPIGPDNALYLFAEHEYPLTVVGWGAHAGDRGREITAQLQDAGVQLRALAVNRDGSPAHPLYLRASLTPQPYPSEPPRRLNPVASAQRDQRTPVRPSAANSGPKRRHLHAVPDLSKLAEDRLARSFRLMWGGRDA